MGAELSSFWAAYGEAHEGVRRNAIDGAVKAAQEFRRANRYPDDHVVRVEFPSWLFNILSDDERLVMANTFNLHVVPRGAERE